ncbi:MAG: PAS domain S-box protein [Clostridiales bacterium]|nr:PAS domain S-box protein [Clostridiales bacterium]
MDLHLILICFIILADVIFLALAGGFMYYIYRVRTKEIVKYALGTVNSLVDSNVNIDSFVYPCADIKPFAEKLKEISDILGVKEKHRKEVLNIVNSVAINMELTALLEDLLPKIIKATDSACAAFYMANHATNQLEIKSSVGFSKNLYNEFDMTIGEGLIGTSVKEIRIIDNLPDDSEFMIKTFLGKIKPKSVMIIPVLNADQLTGVLCLASFNKYQENQNEIVELIRYYVGISIGNAITYEQTKRLSNELRFQNTLIQNLNDDLEKKVDNRTVFLNNIIDSILDYGIYALDVDNNITAWNKGAETLLGVSKDDVIGKNAEVIMTPSDIKAGKLARKIEIALRDGRYEESGWMPKKDGSSYFSESILFPMYDNEKNCIGFTNIIKDMTYLKNVEKALGYEKEFTQKIFEITHQAVIVSSQRGIIEKANTTAENLMQEGSLVGKDLCRFFLEPEYLRQSLTDVAQRYGRGEWASVMRKDRRSLGFNVYVLMESGEGEPKLFLYLTE